jgi:membrane protein YqaA with SNARE-associated domain
MFNTLYKKCLNLAEHKSSKFYLAFVSFIESSFFPIPPDVMIIPMVISKKNDFLKIFFIATIFSVLGGIIGYFLGAFFFDIGIQIMSFYGYEDKLSNLKNDLTNSDGFYAWLGILFLAGFTPLPYKVFTIASGLIGFNILTFIFISFISRGMRFFIVSYLSYKFGDIFTEFMNKHGSKWFTIIGISIFIIGIIFYFIQKFHASI